MPMDQIIEIEGLGGSVNQIEGMRESDLEIFALMKQAQAGYEAYLQHVQMPPILEIHSEMEVQPQYVIERPLGFALQR